MNRIAAVAVLVFLLSGPNAQAQVKPADEVTFFPTYSYYEPATPRMRCVFEVHGWIYEPVRESLKRKALLAVLRKTLGVESEDPSAGLFDERARWFLVENKEHRRLDVRFGIEVHSLGVESDEAGHVRSRLVGWEGKESDLTGEAELKCGWVKFEAVTEGAGARKFKGEVLFMAPAGVSVVSDIDDTIKVTNVRDRRALVRNTFEKPYEAVPGMADLYRALAARGAAFHYLSTGPWQLYPPIREFIDAKKFPLGTFHMRDFSLTHSEFFSLFESPDKWKPTQIEPLIERFPKRRFILIGDSGEKDPETYGALARKYPEQVAGSFIRNVTKDPADPDRFKKAFEGVPPEKWKVFRDPVEVLGKALELTK